MPRRVYTHGETFSADLEFSNYSEKPVSGVHPSWKITCKDGLIGSGTLAPLSLPIGSGIKAGNISFAFKPITLATKATVEVSAPEAGATNSWNIWIFPSKHPPDPADVLVTTSIGEALDKLKNGGSVLYVPSQNSIRQRQETSFLPAFWSPVYFTNQPGTMGLLIQDQHPALADFPTEDHSDWQWWSILTPSPGAVVLDQVKLGRPIVQVIDAFSRNQKLGLVFEAKVGPGHLLVCSADFSPKGLENPVRLQLRSSLLDYLGKAEARHLPVLTESDLRTLFRDEPSAEKSKNGEWSKDLEPPPAKK
jgi:hypothetical protein